jgi:GTP-binding protein
VILRDGPAGEKLEPFEEVHVETSPETVGVVVEMLGKRRGQLIDMQDNNAGSTHLTYIAPTRGLLGFRYQFLTATRGMGVMHSVFHDYLPLAGAMASRARGSLVAWETGVTTTYGLKNGEERGVLFLGPGIEVYQGMVVGEHQRPGDLDVNVCKARHLDNIRSATKEIQERLTPPRQLSLDECMEYLADDELLEVTPQSLRIRKRILDKHNRDKAAKAAKVMMA